MYEIFPEFVKLFENYVPWKWVPNPFLIYYRHTDHFFQCGRSVIKKTKMDFYDDESVCPRAQDVSVRGLGIEGEEKHILIRMCMHTCICVTYINMRMRNTRIFPCLPLSHDAHMLRSRVHASCRQAEAAACATLLPVARWSTE